MRSLAAILAPFACACATSKVEAPARRPVLLIHGLDDTARGLRPMFDFLVARGWRDVQAIELTPNDGSSGLIALAEQVDRAARDLVERTTAQEIDVVAFSMGALVARYWMKRLNPPMAVRTYVSISGPHHGTWTGYLRFNEGARQMRVGSPFIQDLERDEGDWGGTIVYSFWTPLDLMIVPASSSRLKGAREKTFRVMAHPLMLFDERVLTAVVEALDGAPLAADPAARAPSWP
ncbi:MAG TPA: lipase [Myxococcaceae bacterium]|nr:lipase [Myxococcaceae bacterium]